MLAFLYHIYYTILYLFVCFYCMDDTTHRHPHCSRLGRCTTQSVHWTHTRANASAFDPMSRSSTQSNTILVAFDFKVILPTTVSPRVQSTHIFFYLELETPFISPHLHLIVLLLHGHLFSCLLLYYVYIAMMPWGLSRLLYYYSISLPFVTYSTFFSGSIRWNFSTFSFYTWLSHANI